MKNASEIEAEFRSKAIIRGGLLLFRPADAVDLIRKCSEEKLGILGLDGFLITGNSTQPLMEHSVDFSSKSRTISSQGYWQAAEEFLCQKQSSGLLFEVVIE